jgi:hypothetical protein
MAILEGQGISVLLPTSSSCNVDAQFTKQVGNFQANDKNVISIYKLLVQ